MNDESWDTSVSPHRPLHWYVDEACYWVTGATLEHRPYFRADPRKERFVDEMHQAAEAWRVDLVAWTLMEHHYHVILRLQRGRSLPQFLGRLHTRTATFVNREDGTPGRQVWRQYWDTVIRTEGDFWCRVNYIWQNPVKHGFCSQPEDWPWTNLESLMSAPDEPSRAALERFPAPRHMPADNW